MDNEKMIPANIWESDCKYCMFRESEENFAYGSRGNRYEKPCRLRKYERNTRYWNEKTKKFDLTDYEIYKEHCGSCRPAECFGICARCEYFNQFHDTADFPGGIYCTHSKGPLNRRNTKPHIKAGYSKEVTSYDYTYFTCDRYIVDHYWKETLKRQALKGRIPKNFDPDTFKPLEYIEGELIEVWQEKQREYEDNKPENVKKKKMQQLIRQRMRKEESQEC
jgi:hypothetical protein